ncbi:MAG: TolC family protein [Bryobacteraceae bacterium]|nr:TolC family protein [Bryobacteraceae bacterium]
MTAIALLALAADPLTLQEVLQSVNRNYPPLLAALAERPLAEADVLSSLGRFDLVVKAAGQVDELGPLYNDRQFGVSVEQALAPGGISYFSGYRVARGTFAEYDGKEVTNTAGEYRAGVRVPLARDRAIDSRRADLAKARIGRRLADLSIDQQRIVIAQAATRRYWDWTAAGLVFKVAQAILDIAVERENYLRDSVQAGASPAIDVTDNARVILQRRSALVSARRSLEQAAIELSLFYRDPSGDPVLVGEDRLPPSFPAPAQIDDKRLRDDIALALDRRPEVSRLLAQRDQIDIDRRLAINQQYPGLDFLFSYARQLGEKRTSRGPDELRATLNFELPLQRRTARGREDAADARLAQIEQRTRFQRDQIAAEVRDAVSAVRAAYERVAVLGDEVRTTKEVENAERERYQLGDTNLFTLNLREIATVDAQVREVTALADYYRAYALYELSIAQALAPAPPRP